MGWYVYLLLNGFEGDCEGFMFRVEFVLCMLVLNVFLSFVFDG